MARKPKTRGAGRKAEKPKRRRAVASPITLALGSRYRSIPASKSPKAGRPAARRTPAARPAVKRRPIERQRVRSVERAIRTIGAKRIKATPVKVSSSRYVTASRRGVASKGVRRVLDAIARQPGNPLYAYTLKLKYRTRDGRTKRETVEGVGVPMLKSAARRRRKGETAKQALKRLVLRDITLAAHSTIRGEWAKYDLGDRSTPMGRKRAARILRDVKRREQLRVKVEFYRVAGREKKPR